MRRIAYRRLLLFFLQLRDLLIELAFKIGRESFNFILKPISQNQVARPVPQAPKLDVGESPFDHIRIVHEKQSLLDFILDSNGCS